MTTRPAPPDPTASRRARYRAGHVSEVMAAAYLMAKGYRVIARRCVTAAGEIDLIAIRGRTLAFVEVKRRPTLIQAEAAMTDRQSARIRRAADLWLAQHPPYQAHDIRFDAVFLIRRAWPRHVEGRL